jgi:hypothetical protein
MLSKSPEAKNCMCIQVNTTPEAFNFYFIVFVLMTTERELVQNFSKCAN